MEDIEEMKDADSLGLVSYKTKFCLAFSGMLFFPLLHQLIGLLIRRRCPWMEKGAIFRISTRIVSSIQALMVVTISARCIFVCKNIMTDEDPYIHAYIWFGVSYFPYDIVMMYVGYTYHESWQKYHKPHSKSFMRFFRREPVLVLHHIIFLCFGLPVSEVYKKRLGDFFLASFFLAEASTPFYNVRGVLKEVGIKDGYLFLVNGVLFLVIFLLCRVLSVPFMFLRYSYHADIRFAHVPLNIPYKCTLTCLSFFLLQFYWFILICRGLQRFLFKTVSKAS